MKRSEVEHVLRAAAAISQEQSFTLLARIGQLDAGSYPVQTIADWARRRATEAQQP